MSGHATLDAGELESRTAAVDALRPDELEQWTQLARRDPAQSSPFLSPDYARAVAAVRPGARACVLRREGRAVAFLPFQFARPAHRLLRAAEPVGGLMTDAFGLVAEAGLRVDPATLLRAARLDALLFTHLLDTQTRHGLAGEVGEPGLAIDFPAGGAAYWQELREARKDFVDKTERRERKLARELGELVFRFRCDDPLARLHELVERKREQYRRTGAPDALAEPWRRELLARLATSTASGCEGVLSTLHAGGTLVAMHFGLRSGALLHYWFPVYNPDLAKHSPGRLLLKAILLASPETGLARIDRGAGDTQAKRELANVERSYSSGLWRRPGWRAGLFRAGCAIAWRVGRRAE